jgi:UDP-glucose 4-epimerase
VHPDAAFHQVDICDLEALKAVFDAVKPDYISHQAALADVRDSVAHPEAYAQVNILGTLNLLHLAASRGVRKIVMASTGGAIYGDAARLPADETSAPQPLDPYGVSKLAGEHYLYTYQHNHGLPFCALRYGNVYGPRQNPRGEAGVVAIFSGRMLENKPVVIHGDGLQQRDFIYGGDVARANALALKNGKGIYNIGTGVATDVNTIFRELARLTHYAGSETHGEAKAGEVRAISIDSRRAGQELGWKAQMPLADGLARTVEAMRDAIGRA